MKSVLILFILSSLCFAASLTEVNMFVYDYLNENETFTKTPFNLTDGEYYIINISGEPSFLVSAPFGGGVRMLTEKEEIQTALYGYYETLGITKDDLKVSDTLKSDLLQLVDLYNSTRGNEYECKRYIGIDRFECVDYDSCWRACYTPVCQQMKIGAGKKFLDLIWDFSNLTNSIDSNISAFNEKLLSLSEFKTLYEIDELVSFIRSMKDNSIAINNNDMFNPMVMGFCRLISYNLSYLTQAEISLLSKKERITPLLTLQGTAERFYNTTLERIRLKEQLIIEKLCSSLTANNSQMLSSFKMGLGGLNTSRMNEKVSSLEEAAKLEGCNRLNQTQIQNAEALFISLLNETQNYGEELAEVMSLKDEVKSSLSGMQDVLLYFKLGEFNSRMSEIEMKIDFAERSQLPNIKTQLLQLKEEMEEAEGNKPLSFITGFATSPFAIVVVLLIIFLITRLKK